MALPCHMVRGMEGVRACLFGASGGETWRIDAGDDDERCKVFFPMDCDSGRLARCPPSIAGAGWFIANGSIRTRFPIRLFATVSFLACCPACVGPWPSPGSLI